MNRRKQNAPKPQESPRAYSIQATPLVLRDLGEASKHLPGGSWDFLKTLAEGVFPTFENADFRQLVFQPDGTTYCEGLGPTESVKVFMTSLASIAGCPDRTLMIVPYRDKDNIKVLYFKWEDETLYDSFSVPDGQNRAWKNQEKL